ncbi:DUF6171 family protein [Paenibacillus sp. WQ 127069]|uniref:DUF6171 family protein n=1 Tax=Paenibacillus baimaensis TaxID=2982185 RepID=A0ABT2UG46_9BACL|nr:DUF6171 family protein [Paenibacillus sp. WQ 127069]MCU6792639.1 DUF6171 family protein [Paenibacillus sp. WQ 127069]
MTRQGPCKDCSETIHVTPEKIKTMLQMLIDSRHVELADDVISAGRLAQCVSCTGYTLGGTCKYCGCLVQIRTKIKDRGCPYPLTPKW